MVRLGMVLRILLILTPGTLDGLMRLICRCRFGFRGLCCRRWCRLRLVRGHLSRLLVTMIAMFRRWLLSGRSRWWVMFRWIVIVRLRLRLVTLMCSRPLLRGLCVGGCRVRATWGSYVSRLLTGRPI